MPLLKFAYKMYENTLLLHSCKLNIQHSIEKLSTHWRATSYIHFLHISVRVQTVYRNGRSVYEHQYIGCSFYRFADISLIMTQSLKSNAAPPSSPLDVFCSVSATGAGPAANNRASTLYISITADLLFNEISVSHRGLYYLFRWAIWINLLQPRFRNWIFLTLKTIQLKLNRL